ncbi:MAG: hypothetical protein FJX30_05915, partial [Alphaproteobacteria bacterium]|nr:hypothetical protein [Alphaproteobacteria bacterium]
MLYLKLKRWTELKINLKNFLTQDQQNHKIKTMIDLNLNRQKIRELPKPDTIIFDWDNTLVDTWPLIQIAINKTMKQMNKDPWSLEKVRDTVHKSMRESFPEIFGNDWQKAGE